MRHFSRLNRVAYGILRRRHPTMLTLLEQNDYVWRRAMMNGLTRNRWFFSAHRWSVWSSPPSI